MRERNFARRAGSGFQPEGTAGANALSRQPGGLMGKRRRSEAVTVGGERSWERELRRAWRLFEGLWLFSSKKCDMT